VIHLNHAGTSWPKPEPVRAAVRAALEADVATWPETFAQHHREVATWLGAEPSRLLLTPGCTSALAVAVADQPWEDGDRILVDALAHHALYRPVWTSGRDHVVVATLEEIESELRAGGVRLVCVSWAANVTGALAPVEEVLALARRHGARVLVDAAQVAGWIDLDVAALGADMLAFAGHKGPQAPWGVGGLYVAPGLEMRSPLATCEVGVECSAMPGYCDTGSVDRAALAGLVAGIGWLAERPDRLVRARRQIARLTGALPDDAVVVGPRDATAKMPTLAFTWREPPAVVAARLRERGVLVSAGIQCAPLAHDTLGTEPDGVVRLSVGPATSDDAIDAACEALAEALR